MTIPTMSNRSCGFVPYFEANVFAMTNQRERAAADMAFSVDVAIGLAALGQTDAVFDWLENALARGYSAWRFISEYNQAFAPLRSHSRFVDITTRMRRACSDRRREMGIV